MLVWVPQSSSSAAVGRGTGAVAYLWPQIACVTREFFSCHFTTSKTQTYILSFSFGFTQKEMNQTSEKQITFTGDEDCSHISSLIKVFFVLVYCCCYLTWSGTPQWGRHILFAEEMNEWATFYNGTSNWKLSRFSQMLLFTVV